MKKEHSMKVKMKKSKKPIINIKTIKSK
jgi:hypothetical protein